MDLAPTLFGLLVGFLVGLTGVGGGSLMTPFLITVVGVSAPTAVVKPPAAYAANALLESTPSNHAALAFARPSSDEGFAFTLAEDVHALGYCKTPHLRGARITWTERSLR